MEGSLTSTSGLGSVCAERHFSLQQIVGSNLDDGIFDVSWWQYLKLLLIEYYKYDKMKKNEAGMNLKFQKYNWSQVAV